MEEEFQIPEDAMERLRDPEVIKTYIAEGKTFQEILGYDNEIMEKFYQGACRLFENRRYDEASDAFVFLTTLNPYVHNFWLALGMAEQSREEFSAALVAYGMAGINDPSNPVSLWHTAHCHYLMSEPRQAREMLERLLNVCEGREEHTELVSRGKTLLNRLSN